MTPIQLIVSETFGVNRNREQISVGVPFPKGVAQCSTHFALQNETSNEIPHEIEINAEWSDGSIKWLLLSFCSSIESYSSCCYTLSIAKKTSHKSSTRLSTEQTEDYVRVSTSTLKVEFNKSHPVVSIRPINQDSTQRQTKCALSLTDDQNTKLDNASLLTEVISHPNGQKCEVIQKGTFIQDEKVFCNFKSTYLLYADSSQIKWTMSIHNPNPAAHPNGLWDLGDPGSIFFNGFSASIETEQSSTFSIKPEEKSEWFDDVSEMTLFQESSGGEQWKSSNHINKDGVIPQKMRGYKGSIDKSSLSGERASPTLQLIDGPLICLNNFWQNFPKNLTCSNGVANFELFPQCFNSSFELQGGEKKTHSLLMDFNSNKRDSINKPLEVNLTPAYIASTNTLIHHSEGVEPIDRLINVGITGPHSFIQKRELIDEYGWRNFGDIFADHESLYLKENKKFISHYNNQYDPLYGFIRQHLNTGNPVWLSMANELAQHITDIDIYDTTEDRAEYNGGLFWHTDHYVDAYTASHRTYSKHQVIDESPTQGGGPGAEHCYTHGLLLHHYITGSLESKTAVLALTKWITHFYEGTGSFVEQLLTTKKQLIPKIKAGLRTGKVLNHTYPLDRGVGNYICALLDSFALTQDEQYINNAERVIRQTVHPADDIENRDLDNPETTWFYTIFLQAVIRYIGVTEEAQGVSTPGHTYATSIILHYAEWMRDNEQTYLSRKETLDYPNDTWVAQELRKANILYYASSICPENQQKRYKEKADYFYNYVNKSLEESETKHFSRILAILMQNHGPHRYYSQIGTTTDSLAKEHDPTQAISPYITLNQQVIQTLKYLISSLFSLSIKRELSWLRHRHTLFAKLYKAIYK